MEYLDNPANIAAFALLVFLFVQERSTVRKALESQLRIKEELEKKLKKKISRLEMKVEKLEEAINEITQK